MKVMNFTTTLLAAMLMVIFSGGNSQAVHLPAWDSEGSYGFKDSLLHFVDKSGKTAIVKRLSDWQLKRAQILEGMELTMGKLPDLKNLPGLNVQVIDSLTEADHTRYNIRFTVATDEVL